MTAPFQLRDGHASDRPMMRQVLEMAALASYPDLRALGRLTLRDRLDALFASYDLPGRRWWIAERDQEALGGLWAIAGLHPILETPETLIVAVGVVEAARGQGVARALMTHARDVLKAEGYDALRLFVHPDNAPARALYASLGFESTTLELTWR
ncbi:GNAT family N-acetyltransferase [bacterium]|nr:GNAT family N-acetyltransferase [bacterium]